MYVLKIYIITLFTTLYKTKAWEIQIARNQRLENKLQLTNHLNRSYMYHKFQSDYYNLLNLHSKCFLFEKKWKS